MTARFVDVAVDKLFFTIILTDELNALKVFETLNARGVRLSATDLLKNYLFSVVSRDNAHESDINNLEDRWEGVDCWAVRAFPSSCGSSGTVATGWCARWTCSKPCAAPSAIEPVCFS